MTILIVEDNSSVRRMLHRVLEGIATHVSECSDGADALACYKATRPDVVLMDIHMPEMDGVEATRQIRQFHAEACVVMVTNLDDNDMRMAAYEAGASGYALKQNLTDLGSVIRAALCLASRTLKHQE